ncbi:hypothetical protein EDB83DRAFT_2326391 [Lactarius deliciosus]|nr:hypothetical protein EDB83DRAFT_2326391 [Lactarius deliciosus]
MMERGLLGIVRGCLREARQEREKYPGRREDIAKEARRLRKVFKFLLYNEDGQHNVVGSMYGEERERAVYTFSKMMGSPSGTLVFLVEKFENARNGQEAADSGKSQNGVEGRAPRMRSLKILVLSLTEETKPEAMNLAGVVKEGDISEHFGEKLLIFRRRMQQRMFTMSPINVNSSCALWGPSFSVVDVKVYSSKYVVIAGEERSGVFARKGKTAYDVKGIVACHFAWNNCVEFDGVRCSSKAQVKRKAAPSESVFMVWNAEAGEVEQRKHRSLFETQLKAWLLLPLLLKVKQENSRRARKLFGECVSELQGKRRISWY